MTLTITDRLICSDLTHHTAKLVGQGDEAGWRVSWLPHQPLTLSQAEAAVNIAEAFERTPSDRGLEVWNDGFWPRVERWATQLGMNASLAEAIINSMPRSEEITD
jgi:hypothetical protein